MIDFNKKIIDDCEFEHFHKLVAELKAKFQIEQTNFIHDFDQIYLDFIWHEFYLTLDYNVSEGISIYFTPECEQTNEDIDKLNSLCKFLSDSIKNIIGLGDKLTI